MVLDLVDYLFYQLKIGSTVFDVEEGRLLLEVKCIMKEVGGGLNVYAEVDKIDIPISNNDDESTEA